MSGGVRFGEPVFSWPQGFSLMKNSKGRHPARSKFSLELWVLCAFLVLVFLTGGSSRADVLSLPILKPTAVLACGWSIYRTDWAEVRPFRLLFVLAIAMIAIVTAHLVPLPPLVWQAMPGRDLAIRVDEAAGLVGTWRPISLVPWASWNALFFLASPLATLILATKINSAERYFLLPLIVVLGGASALLGLFQTLSPAGGALYLYKGTHDGNATGLFANRNHAAVLLALLFPMLAVLAAWPPIKKLRRSVFLVITAAGGAVLVPLLMVTGSRSGLLVGVLCLISVGLLYRRRDEDKAEAPSARRRIVRLAVGAALAALVSATFLFSRAEAIDRFMASDQMNERRFQIWGPILEMGWKYFPVGSGMGTIIEAYQVDEPDQILLPTYVNRAHNEPLELFMTGGLPALLLLLAVLVAWCIGSFAVWRQKERSRTMALGRLASIMLAMLGLASLGDYPLRTHSLMCVAVIAGVWLTEAAQRRTEAPA